MRCREIHHFSSTQILPNFFQLFPIETILKEHIKRFFWKIDKHLIILCGTALSSKHYMVKIEFQRLIHSFIALV